jgi:hypothetical protein
VRQLTDETCEFQHRVRIKRRFKAFLLVFGNGTAVALTHSGRIERSSRFEKASGLTAQVKSTGGENFRNEFDL